MFMPVYWRNKISHYRKRYGLIELIPIFYIATYVTAHFIFGAVTLFVDTAVTGGSNT